MRRIVTTLMAACLLFLSLVRMRGMMLLYIMVIHSRLITRRIKCIPPLSLYESIARQPEMAKELIQATAKLAQYDTITAITPLDKEAEVERGTARGKMSGGLFFRYCPSTGSV